MYDKNVSLYITIEALKINGEMGTTSQAYLILITMK